MTEDTAEVVRRYHEATKHQPDRYAPSLGYLDWATQPFPFRRFEGAELHRLPFPRDEETPAIGCLYAGGCDLVPLEISSIARLFYFSLSISAWKQHRGSKWALRVNPSSGNLHPTEAYLLAGGVPGLSDAPALFHYAPDLHALERRADLEPTLQDDPPLIILTSIPWREAWKYGARAYRYCQHDAGHALAALRLSAALLGWSVRLLPEVSRRRLAALAGLDRQDGGHAGEVEVADMVLQLETRSSASPTVSPDLCTKRAVIFHGSANRLSRNHHPWPVIDEVEMAVTGAEISDPEKGLSRGKGVENPDFGASSMPRMAAGTLIRQRRSAVAMDGRTHMTRETLLAMLARTLPSWARSPWDALSWHPRVHLALFIHRVDDLPPGLYLLVRNPGDEALLRTAMRQDFAWRQPDATPDGLDLYLLAETDTRDLAQMVSCHQEIAADGAFGVGMLARFEPELKSHGAACYPQLFWETGAIGQVLYLEAEAAGLRATGIGCFFDDPMHEILGLRDRTFQSLYHFTVGKPVEDTRITTLPAYAEDKIRDKAVD